MTSLLMTAAVAFALAAALTRLMIPWLRERGAVATENERTMHSGTVPKGGGLPLLLALVAALLVFHPSTGLPLALNAGLIIAAAVSWRDDVTPLTPAIRLQLHFLAAACFVLALPADASIFQGLLPLALDRALGVLLLAGFMNFFNFMDGINGIAGAEAVAIAGGYLLLSLTTIALAYAPLAAALLGASTGFLLWNMREKALVFLGDTGSVPLGLLTGALMIDLAVKGYWPAALILPSYFVADASITLLKRLARGEKIWEAHKAHAYQRAAQAFGAHLPVVWRVSAANTSLIAAALWSVALPLPGLASAAVVLAVLFWMLARTRP